MIGSGNILTYTAGGAIGAKRFVKAGGTAGQVVTATAGTFFGVCRQPGGAASGERIDVQHDGIAKVIAGGTISAPGPVASDANGAAVAAAPASGANLLVAGFMLTPSAVAGDEIDVQLAPHTMQGA